jgi:hypothetical protein
MAAVFDDGLPTTPTSSSSSSSSVDTSPDPWKPHPLSAGILQVHIHTQKYNCINQYKRYEKAQKGPPPLPNKKLSGGETVSCSIQEFKATRSNLKLVEVMAISDRGVEIGTAG